MSPTTSIRNAPWESRTRTDIPDRTGYELIWGDRQAVLEVLRDNLRDQSKLLVNKQVESIDHSASGVKVQCKDGSVYDGDSVVGADGVYSKVRQEMWRFAEKTSPELVRSERNGQSFAGSPSGP